jgi:hypothetical protein
VTATTVPDTDDAALEAALAGAWPRAAPLSPTPVALLDEVLRDRNPAGIPRRLDGRLSTGDLARS